jgi:hypothetical protein
LEAAAQRERTGSKVLGVAARRSDNSTGRGLLYLHGAYPLSGKPVRAGIDPFHELIDAHPDDNARSL